MATKRWIPFLLPAAVILALAGCSGTANVQNPPPPPQNPVKISFTIPPAPSISVSSSETITATVTNDPSKAGVTLVLTCPVDPKNASQLCGTVSPSSITNNDTLTATYTAPPSLATNTTSCPGRTDPTNCMSVEIVAFANADTNQNSVGPFQVNSYNTQLTAGNYVIQEQGANYQLVAVISLDGAGKVTGGEQTVNSNGVSVTDTINPTGSNYFIGRDGRGTININTGDPAFGTEIFSLVFLTSSQNPRALISQTGADVASFSATGTMDLQDPTAAATAPSGSFAFVVGGLDALDNVPLAFGGVFNIPSGQTAISGVTDELVAGVQKLNGMAFPAGSKLSLGPDPFGKVVFTLPGYENAQSQHVTVLLSGYIVDATHIRLIETDTDANSGVTPFGTTGGLAIAQAAGSQSFSGNYVYGITGVDLSPVNGGYTPSTWTVASVLTVPAGQGQSGNLSGFMDNFLQLNCVQAICKNSGDTISGAQISSSFAGSYSVDSNSRTTLSSFVFNSAPGPVYDPTLYLYLTGNASPEPAALVLAAGDLTHSPKLHYPSIGTGVAYAQSNGNMNLGDCPVGPTCYYGFTFTQVNTFGENDGTAQMGANSTASPQVSGVADSTGAQPPPADATQSDHAFSGSFSTPQSNSVFTGTLANYNSLGQGFDGSVFTVGNNNNNLDAYNLFDVNYYPIDQNNGFWIETDLITGISGEQTPPPSGQVSLGYYTARTPVCAGCP